jgi:hypothetical protein
LAVIALALIFTNGRLLAILFGLAVTALILVIFIF